MSRTKSYCGREKGLCIEKGGGGETGVKQVAFSSLSFSWKEFITACTSLFRKRGFLEAYKVRLRASYTLKEVRPNLKKLGFPTPMLYHVARVCANTAESLL